LVNFTNLTNISDEALPWPVFFRDAT